MRKILKVLLCVVIIYGCSSKNEKEAEIVLKDSIVENKNIKGNEVIKEERNEKQEMKQEESNIQESINQEDINTKPQETKQENSSSKQEQNEKKEDVKQEDKSTSSENIKSNEDDTSTEEKIEFEEGYTPYVHLYLDDHSYPNETYYDPNLWFDSLEEVDEYAYLLMEQGGIDGTYSSFQWSAPQCSCGKYGMIIFNISHYE